MDSKNTSSHNSHPDIPQDELLQVIGDFLAMGHVDNIRALFTKEPEHLELSGLLLHDERFSVRLGMAVLFEYLIEECPEEMHRALPSLHKQLTNNQDHIRGEALNLLGIIGTPEALEPARPLLNDSSRQVAEIAEDIMAANDDA